MVTFLFGPQRTGKSKRSKSCRPGMEWMEPRTLLSAVTWTGGAGDNNWDTAANWNIDSVPTPGDDVTINIAANVVHSSNVTDSINSLTSTEPLTVSGGTLSIAAASTIGSLAISGGTLTGTGDVSVSGLVTLTAGTLSGSSALNANGGMVINPTGGNFNLDGRTVNNAVGQTATWTGTLNDFIEASDGSVFNNLGTFVDEGLALYEQSGTGAPSAFNNVGSFTTATSANLEFDVPFNLPGGSVDVKDNSQLDLAQGGTVAGAAFNTESNGSLDLTNYVFDTATTISGSGGLELTAMVLPGNYTFTGSSFVEGGTLQVDGSLSGSAVSFREGTMSGTGTVGAMSVGDGNVSPGDGPDPGILNANGDVVFAPPNLDEEDVGSTFTVVLNGATAGTGYSQLNVNGSVDLGGSTFNPSLGFTPSNGEQFTIIKSTVPIVGTFMNLPEGSPLTIGNTQFTISYVGGDGHDVVLTQSNIAAPAVTGITPSSGPELGGTSVTITGTGFAGATVVDFGTAGAANFTVVNDTTITADSPAGTGVVDVTVTTPVGTTATSPADEFTYVAAAAPAVTGLSPTSGPAAGGTLVTITGTGFTGATEVDFGTTASVNFAVVNDTTITAISPAGTGVVDVTVTTPVGTSATSSADEFTYIALAAPTVTGVSPNSGPAAGGTLVTITGTGFSGVTAVDFGTTASVNFTVVNDTTITADSPAGTGTVNATVITRGGTSAISAADQFTYVAAPPKVMSLVRFGFHMQQTTLVLTVSSALDPTSANDVKNYQIVTTGGLVIPVRAAVYDAATLTVTLFPAKRLNLHVFHQLTVNGASSVGLAGATGVPLDGLGNGALGTNFVRMFSGEILAGPASAMLSKEPKEFAAAQKQLAADEKKWASEPKKAGAAQRALAAAQRTLAAHVRPSGTPSTTWLSASRLRKRFTAGLSSANLW